MHVTQLILLVVLCVCAVAAWRYRQHRLEQRIRWSDPPQRTSFEVALPRGIADGRERVVKFYRQALALTVADGAPRREGKGQIDLLFLASSTDGRPTPELRFYVVCDADKAERLKHLLQNSFHGDAEIIRHDGDPLDELAENLRAQRDRHGDGDQTTQEDEY